MEIKDRELHRITMTAIIYNNSGKYLIVQRSLNKKVFPGKWTVPGGKLEVLDYALKQKDTSSHWYNVFENVAKREVKEEVGFELKNIGYVASLVYIRPDGIPAIIVSLYAEPKEENAPVKLCDALTDFAWVTLEEAKNYDLIEGIYEELEILDKKLKTGFVESWRKK